MKLTLRFLCLLVIGILTAIIIYPFLHESGHSLAVLLLGGRIKSFNIFPIPNILCQMKEYSKTDFFIIGFSGILLPCIISSFIPKRKFWLCYVKTVISFICLLSFLLGIVSAYLYQKGSKMQNDDITIILQNSPEYLPLCLVLLMVSTIISTVLFIKNISALKKLV